MKTIRINQIYRWHGDQPPSELIEAFNRVVAFPTISPAVKMALYAVGDELHKRIEHAQKTHAQIQSTYTEPGDPGEKLIWIGEDEEARRHSEESFMRDFNDLLNTEIEIRPIPLSALQTASERWWMLVDRGMMNGDSRPLDEAINALMPLIVDDLTPPVVVDAGNTTKEQAAQKRKRK